ncbi:MAG: hypothetical protein GWN00_29190 [Aliifodinibius sp.]|nr:uroporphyrinogen-III synthase [Fodinibius sp.]NIV14847.1 hypothetical protein [Fodinibius sp.]NIY28726.1 hypothetical protein [Fodinibius sp.]
MNKVLSGKTVVVTRAVEQAREFIDALKDAGAEVIHIPTIEFTAPDSWGACDNAIDQLSNYDWFIFTSTNGVRFFVQRLQERDTSIDKLKTRQIAVVGERTADELTKLGVSVDLIPKTYSAEGLLECFATETLNGANILIPKAREGREVLEHGLRARGATVDAVPVYKTQAAKPPGFITEKMNGHHIDLLTFTSPSTFRNLLEMIGEEQIHIWKRQGTAIAAIGPVTADAITKQGFHVEILPQTSTIEGLMEEIVRHYQS